MSSQLPPPPPPPDRAGSAGVGRPEVTDDELLAKELGVSVGEVRASLEFGGGFDLLVRDVLLPLGVVAEYRFDGAPARSAEVYFVGGVPEVAVAAVRGMDVRLYGGAAYSLGEQKLLVEKATAALAAYRPQNALIVPGRDGVTVTVDETELSPEQLEEVRASAIEESNAALVAAGNAAAADRLSPDSFAVERVHRSQLPMTRRKYV